MRSRLKQNIKQQNVKTIAIIVGIILVLALFGTQLLIAFSVVLDKIKGSDETNIEAQSVNYIAPPVINPLPDATNKERIDVSGFATAGDVSVNLYVNDTLSEKTKSKSDNTFAFSGVKLDKGENELKAKVTTQDKKESDYSEVIKIKYLDKEPSLEIKEPTDGQKFKKDQSPVRISGHTDAGAKITVNDFWAITSGSGDFYYMYPLKDGGNNLKIVATDEAGNKTTKELNIQVE